MHELSHCGRTRGSGFGAGLPQRSRDFRHPVGEIRRRSTVKAGKADGPRARSVDDAAGTTPQFWCAVRLLHFPGALTPAAGERTWTKRLLVGGDWRADGHWRLPSARRCRGPAHSIWFSPTRPTRSSLRSSAISAPASDHQYEVAAQMAALHAHFHFEAGDYHRRQHRRRPGRSRPTSPRSSSARSGRCSRRRPLLRVARQPRQAQANSVIPALQYERRAVLYVRQEETSASSSSTRTGSIGPACVARAGAAQFDGRLEDLRLPPSTVFRRSDARTLARVARDARADPGPARGRRGVFRTRPHLRAAETAEGHPLLRGRRRRST